MPLNLAPPDWDRVVGGTAESAWLADRDRKVDLIQDMARRVRRTHEELRQRDAVYRCDLKVLQEVPFAADWYVSLAGFAKKTLGNVRERPRLYGMRRQAKGLVEAMSDKPGQGAVVDLIAFSNWINDEIADLIPSCNRSDLDALLRVQAILGGRALGQGQNQGGNEAVFLLKSYLVGQLHTDYACEVLSRDGSWTASRDVVPLATTNAVRIGGRLAFDFRAGGDRPDVRIKLDQSLIAVGEIKARKDLSNTWESWMPQVADHMRTWKDEFPSAARLLLGTVFTQEMVDGSSIRGTRRTGLKDLYDEGSLTAIYNLSHVSKEQDPCAELIAEFRRLLG